jgi:hypothetical protein
MKKWFKTILLLAFATLSFMIVDFFIVNGVLIKPNKDENHITNNNVYISDVICILENNNTYRVHWEADYSISFEEANKINYGVVYYSIKTDNINNVIDSLKSMLIDVNTPYSNIYFEPITLH